MSIHLHTVSIQLAILPEFDYTSQHNSDRANLPQSPKLAIGSNVANRHFTVVYSQ